MRLGRRAGTAVESARLYTERARIADMLQRGAAARVAARRSRASQIAALYRAAGELNEVGGDFYDVFELGRRPLDARDRRRLRQGPAGGRRDRARPPHAAHRRDARRDARGMLDTLHEALRRQPAGADLCTVCLVTLEARGGRAT